MIDALSGSPPSAAQDSERVEPAPESVLLEEPVVRCREGAELDDAVRLLVGLAAITQIRRGQLGLTQEELSRRSGFGRNYVGSIERGKAGLDITRLAMLARGLGYDGVIDLLYRAMVTATRLAAAALWADAD